MFVIVSVVYTPSQLKKKISSCVVPKRTKQFKVCNRNMCNENNATDVAKQICLNEYRLQKTLEIIRNKNKANMSVKHVQSLQTILNI